MKREPFLSRVKLRNYKSIQACDLPLSRLSFLVGPNGSGKSNFLDALRFVADSLRSSLDHAIRDRGGVHEVRRRSAGHPTHFGMRLQFGLPLGVSGHYAFTIGALSDGGYAVEEESCVLGNALFGNAAHFHVHKGVVSSSSVPNPPAASRDRLFLVNASGLPQFRPVYDALSRMGFYNPNPDRLRTFQPPDAGELLARDGSNLASILEHLERHHPSSKARIEEYLSQVVPDIAGVGVKQMGQYEIVEFKQRVLGSQHPWRFLAGSMSDGTLRALAVLVSLFQASNGGTSSVSLVGIEEPETALHPAAAGVLLDSLRDASESVQVIVTSHSPDLLDDSSLPTESILAVSSKDGVTRIAPVDDAGRTILHKGLYTVGELLRQNQLKPRPAQPSEDVTQAELFDEALWSD